MRRSQLPETLPRHPIFLPLSARCSVVTAVRILFLFSICSLFSCSHTGWGVSRTAQAPATNPLLVATQDQELVWERAVDVLHDYQFEIGRENRVGRTIETLPKVGSGLLEPWHKDSVGFTERLESSLQSIRRIVVLSLQPDDAGRGYLVSVTAHKEIEHLTGVAANSPGAATFSENTPLIRDLNQVVGQSSPSQWVPLGRDFVLEQAILNRLRDVYSW